MDELKKWANENKEQAENHYSTDLDSLWEGIDAGLQQKSRSWYQYSWVKYAASVVLILSIGLMIFRPNTGSAGYDLADLSPELADTEYFYSSQLGEKLDIIKASGVEIDPELYADLDQLNAAYEDLKNDLEDNADNAEVVQAMINNYRLRLQMLEQILSEIQDDNKEESNEISI